MRGNKLSNILFIKNKNGFSLIEMMVAVAILGVIVLGLVTFFTGGTKSWVAGQSQLAAQRNARQAMDIMVREIREASDIIASSTSSKKISFNTPWSTNLEYSWLGEKWDPILRGNTHLINNVQSLAFTYFDNSGNLVDPPDSDKVSKVHIDLQVDIDKDSNPDITLNTDINLRNFGL
jgi:prepilin-type N-terminal cleavage/methylation domain-containing protein